jgi:hypothetical protein
MNSQQLIDIARSLVGTGKGLLAINENHSTCDKRFAKLGRVVCSVADRRLFERPCHWCVPPPYFGTSRNSQEGTWIER